MFRFRSILSRVLFLHAAALIVIAIVMPAALIWFLSSDVKDLHARGMREQADTVAGFVSPRADGSLSLELPAGLNAQYSENYGRYAYAVLDDAGRVLFSSHRDRTAIFAPASSAVDGRALEVRRDNRIYSGVSLRKDVAGRAVWVQVAEDLSHRDVITDDVVANFLRQVGWITVPLLLVLLITDTVIFRRAVRPLLDASEQASHISPTRIDVRLPAERIPNEIRPLVTAVNHALDRLEQGFRRQREFAADAAHELRTPLAILRTRIDTMTERASADALRHDVESMTRIVNQLLDAAELDTLVLDPDERVDLQEVCVDLAQFIAPLALAQGKAVALGGTDEPVWIRGNAEMVRRAVRNLVENALKHAPKGTDVDIAVGAQGVVSVADCGEGVPPARRQLIFHRFWPRDRTRGGAGLGLSIVKRIMDVHGGAITVGDRDTGGAIFALQFQLAASPSVVGGLSPGPVERAV